ncbi:hypothetical protein NB640_04300 [Oxalobacter vibrioformis]|uniref:Uncharacterized protein n=1 Tax=Oxalobacter vibrioformis TaxID=933080 RepID=A0A9E9P3C8_9BURK|nr:hypothetical protein [Oxalobacter vibrioformis]WAW10872.1 hypothetical protein NB640_04300 [Oxalobacter vibrioformis]
MDKSLFEIRYRRDILETQTQLFNGKKKEITFAISNAPLDDPDYSEKGRFHLHKNTLLKSIFLFAESFIGCWHSRNAARKKPLPKKRPGNNAL